MLLCLLPDALLDDRLCVDNIPTLSLPCAANIFNPECYGLCPQNRHLAALRREDGQPHEQLTATYMLLYGAMAGGAAETAVYPLAVVQRRLQLTAMRVIIMFGPSTMLVLQDCTVAYLLQPHGLALAQAVTSGGGLAAVQRRGLAAMWAAAASVYRSQGVAGFYTGYLPNILQARLQRYSCWWIALASCGQWRGQTLKSCC